jgi:hypothetical protein
MIFPHVQPPFVTLTPFARRTGQPRVLVNTMKSVNDSIWPADINEDLGASTGLDIALLTMARTLMR